MMARSKEEMELLGFLPPRPGEDPRFGDNPIDIVDNGAFRDIENLDDDFRTGLDVEQDPFLPQVTDDDGVPGFRPFVEASNRFTEAQNLPDGDDLSEEEQEMASVRESTPDDEVLGDELVSKMALRAQAARGEDGRPVSDIAMLTRAANAEVAQAAERAPYVQITPASAATGLLGSQVTLSTANKYDDPVQVASWNGIADPETMPVTVQFIPVVSPIIQNSVTYKQIRAYGQIIFGTRNRYTVEVDVAMGAQLTVNAGAVALLVALESGAPGVGSIDQEIIVAGQISFWPSVRTAPLTRTRYIDSLATGDSSTVTIPAFAKSFTVHRSNNNGAVLGYTVSVQDNRGAVLFTQVVANDAYVATPTLLPGSARTVKIANASGTTITNCEVVFELSL